MHLLERVCDSPKEFERWNARTFEAKWNKGTRRHVTQCATTSLKLQEPGRNRFVYFIYREQPDWYPH